MEEDQVRRRRKKDEGKKILRSRKMRKIGERKE